MTDSQVASELGDRPSRIASQRQRLAEKFDIRTPEQLATVTNEPAIFRGTPSSMAVL
jgi:hypothetical protein